MLSSSLFTSNVFIQLGILMALLACLDIVIMQILNLFNFFLLVAFLLYMGCKHLNSK